jgi:hypothetical protein
MARATLACFVKAIFKLVQATNQRIDCAECYGIRGRSMKFCERRGPHAPFMAHKHLSGKLRSQRREFAVLLVGFSVAHLICCVLRLSGRAQPLAMAATPNGCARAIPVPARRPSDPARVHQAAAFAQRSQHSDLPACSAGNICQPPNLRAPRAGFFAVGEDDEGQIVVALQVVALHVVQSDLTNKSKANCAGEYSFTPPKLCP